MPKKRKRDKAQLKLAVILREFGERCRKVGRDSEAPSTQTKRLSELAMHAAYDIEQVYRVLTPHELERLVGSAFCEGLCASAEPKFAARNLTAMISLWMGSAAYHKIRDGYYA